MHSAKRRRFRRFFLLQINSEYIYLYDNTPYGPYSRGRSVIKRLPHGISRGDRVLTYFGSKSPKFKQTVGLIFEVISLVRSRDRIWLKPHRLVRPPIERSEIVTLVNRGVLGSPFDKIGKKGFNMWEIDRSDYDLLVSRRRISSTDIAANQDGSRGYASITIAPAERAQRDMSKSLSSDDRDLLKIIEIENVLRRTESKSLRFARSKQLVERLKRLYNYRCQLCSPESPQIPPIATCRGTFYVEVHHIRGLSETVKQKDQGDEKTRYVIENAPNTIVVCCYHHKLLHKYPDGFTFHIDKKRFVSNDGKFIIGLKINKHL
nr:hypothetical protein [Candidatus Njordarchaeota archaeon]